MSRTRRSVEDAGPRYHSAERNIPDQSTAEKREKRRKRGRETAAAAAAADRWTDR